ncbi:MAG: AmpG family muropeptide MFS transporter [Pseudomonadota bacterium]|nr:AmpG family muropeptide MFS transporter [Pseudomonadota bacterium]
MLAILCLGFSSGLPLALTASTLGVWLTESGVSKAAIGLFAAAATPYALKFLWSPLIDGMPFPGLSKLLGRRRGWLVATQLALAGTLVLLGLADPAINPWLTAVMALLVAIASASQDIVIDAYRVEILKPEQQGAGAAAAVLGYRLGMIASSAGALYLAAYAGWTIAYWLMAALMGIGMVAVLLSPEPNKIRESEKSDFLHWMRAHVLEPFTDFMQRPHWLVILLFIILYKLGDAFMGVMTNPFLIDIGFTKEQIASIVKLYGVIATIIGSVIGGALVFRWGAARSLWVCGIAHAVTNLMFVLQARAGADSGLLALSITLENISGGMGTSAFVAYLSGLTHARFTATQYALLSSLAAFGRTWLSTPSGWLAGKLGWEKFFLLAALLALPGLVLLLYLMKLNGHGPEKANDDDNDQHRYL